MENKDIYSSAPEEGMETKGTPGYVPAPLIRSDAPQTGGGDATATADDTESGADPGDSADKGVAKSSSGSKTSGAASKDSAKK